MTWFAAILEAIFIFDFSALLFPAVHTEGTLQVSEKTNPKAQILQVRIECLNPLMHFCLLAYLQWLSSKSLTGIRARGVSVYNICVLGAGVEGKENTEEGEEKQIKSESRNQCFHIFPGVLCLIQSDQRPWPGLCKDHLDESNVTGCAGRVTWAMRRRMWWRRERGGVLLAGEQQLCPLCWKVSQHHVHNKAQVKVLQRL